MTTPTPRQQALLRFIHGYQLAHGGVSPTFAECAAGIGVTARSGIHRLLCGLQERGLLRTLPNRSRAMEVLAPPAVPMIGSEPLYAVSWPAIREAQ